MKQKTKEWIWYGIWACISLIVCMTATWLLGCPFPAAKWVSLLPWSMSLIFIMTVQEYRKAMKDSPND